MVLILVVDDLVPAHPVVPVGVAVLAHPVDVGGELILLHYLTAILGGQPCLHLHVGTAPYVHEWHIFTIPDY